MSGLIAEIPLVGRTGELDRIVTALTVGERELAHHRCSPERTQRPEVQLIGMTLAALIGGDLARAEESTLRGYEAGVAAGDDEGVATFALMRGLTNLERGEISEARQRFREGALINEQIADSGPLRWCVAGIALTEAMLGNHRASAEAIGRLDSLPPHWMAALDADLVVRGRVWSSVANGELSLARTELRAALESATEGFEELGWLLLAAEAATEAAAAARGEGCSGGRTSGSATPRAFANGAAVHERRHYSPVRNGHASPGVKLRSPSSRASARARVRSPGVSCSRCAPSRTTCSTPMPSSAYAIARSWRRPCCVTSAPWAARTLRQRRVDTMSLAQRSVIVFGATGGLGRAVLEAARREGATVTGVGTTVPDPEGREAGVAYAAVDVLDEASVAAFFTGLERPPWAIVNLIGGYTPGQRLVDLELPTLTEQLSLNLVTAAAITKHGLRAMAGQGGGRLLHTSSRVALQDGAGGFAYSVSKLAVVRLVEAAAAEALAEGITVNCILPSIIDTPANRASMPTADHERWPKAEQIAAVLCFLMSEASALISGAAIPVYGSA